MSILKVVLRAVITVCSRLLAQIEKEKSRSSLRSFVASMSKDHPFSSFPKLHVGNFFADSKEFFDHYDVFSYWVFKTVSQMGNGHKILDLGGVKAISAVFSVNNSLTSVVLADCGDTLTSVSYVKHDVCKPLPFSDGQFDIFTSTVSLNLLGLGRYGDAVSPNTLIIFLDELNRVMKPKSHLFFSLSIGADCLNFRNTWIFSHETVLRLFGDWKLVDFFIDNQSGNVVDLTHSVQRFSKSPHDRVLNEGQYRIGFYHFCRDKA